MYLLLHFRTVRYAVAWGAKGVFYVFLFYPLPVYFAFVPTLYSYGAYTEGIRLKYGTDTEGTPLSLA